jgi:Cu+-exporting ATPase
MKVTPQETPHRYSHKHQTYFFCSAGCLANFAADPSKFAKPAPIELPAAAGTIYTCPMHSQIRQVGPGTCPLRHDP